MGNKIVRIGLIGAGDHMRNHVSGFEGLQNYEIVAITDPNRENVDKILGLDFINSERISVFANSAEMYEHSSFDAVMSATPDRFHLGDIRDAVNNRKHIMMEKPLVATSSELDELVALLRDSKDKNLVISSCHPRRFDFPQLGLKEMLPELLKELGKVARFSYDFSYTTLKRRGIHEGLLVDHFNHEIDLLNFLFGMSNFNANKLFDSEERYEATGFREDGIVFHFSGTRFLDASSKNYPEFMEIRFEKGVVIVETKTGYVQIHNHETGEKREGMVSQTDYVERLRRVNSNFIRSILGIEKSYLTLENMLLNTSSALTLSNTGTYSSKGDPNIEKLRKVDEGIFKGAKWELIKSDSLPNETDTTAVISLVRGKGGKIFLAKNNDTKKDRGWDLPGGHVDEGETIEEAGRRELYEEAGIQAKNYKLAGYIKITSDTNVPKRYGGYYPNPGYMAFYVGELDGEIDKPTGEEIEISRAFSIEEAMEILGSDMDKSAIKYLLT